MIYKTTAYGAKCDICGKDYLDQYASGFQPSEKDMESHCRLGNWVVYKSGRVWCADCYSRRDEIAQQAMDRIEKESADIMARVEETRQALEKDLINAH